MAYCTDTDRLALPNDTSPTDRTGEIISFSDVGPAVATAFYCYASNIGDVVWQFPNGNEFPVVFGMDAVNNELFISGIFDPEAVIVHRGPDHFSPDGEHCCVVRPSPTMRLCVTFSEC